MSKIKKIFKAKIVKRDLVADNTFRLDLEPEDKNFSFRAGQYVWLRLERLMHVDDRGDHRAFSLISAPGDKTLSIIFRGSTSGFKRSLMEMEIGDHVEAIGPFGSFVDPASEEYVFVAGGVGITPFLSILRDRLKKGFGPKIHLLYSEDSKERLIPEVEKMKKTLKDDEISINIGKLEGEAMRRIKAGPGAVWHFSGPQGMIDLAVSEALSFGIPMERMRFEENWPILPRESKLALPALIKDVGEIYKLSTDNSLIHTIITDVNGKILYANKATSRMTGFGVHEILGRTPRLWGGLMDRAFYDGMWKRIRFERKPFFAKVDNRKKNGERYVVRLSIAPIFDPEDKLIGYTASEMDITESEEIDKIKTELISLASHQLNTPVSTVNWYAEMILSGDVGEITDEQRKYIDQIYDSSQKMSKLIDALLDVSKMELATFMMDEEPTDIVELSKEVVGEFNPIMEKKRLKLTENYATDLPKVTIDPKVPGIVIQNLVSNAVKYTPEGGEISVRVGVKRKGERIDGTKARMDALCICVSDTGYGIPREYHGKIFTKLFRAENIKEYETEGMGLGLYIVKFIVNRAGGDVWFKSEKGKGSTFFVLLPLDGVCKEKQS